MDDNLPPLKPFLVRAIHEWCCEYGYTPYLAVAVDAQTLVPREYVKEGQIVLNLGLEATRQLNLGNDVISFTARFNGVARPISIPLDNVAAIYARENGQGMAFEPRLATEAADTLAVVATPGQEASGSAAEAATAAHEAGVDAEGAPSTTPTVSGGRPHLTRIK